MSAFNPKAPSAHAMDPAACARLESWKEIAVYLGRDLRTVQRWEAAKSLPVHRLGIGRRVPVYAIKAELDAWRLENTDGVENGGHDTKPPLRLLLNPRVAIPLMAVAILLLLVRWIVHEPQGTAIRIVPLTTYTGLSGTPAFSPDGSRLAFGWNGDQRDNMDVYVKLVGSADTPLRMTTDPHNDFAPAWSPDGRRLAFVRAGPKRRCFLFLMPSIPGAESQLVEFSPLTSPRVAWTHDGAYILLPHSPSDSGPSALYLVSVSTGEMRALTSPRPGSRGDLDGAVSPDGRSLAFVRSPAFNLFEIYVQSLSPDYHTVGAPYRISGEAGTMSRPMWTPDSGQIVYYQVKDGSAALWRVRAKPSGVPRLLAPLAQTGEGFAISTQGDRIAYSVKSSAINIWSAALTSDGLAAPSLLVSSTQASSSPSFSPDGSRIAFTSWRSGTSQIWVCERDGSRPRQLTFLDGPLTGYPHWSPDGRSIAFDSRAGANTDVWVISADGGPPRRLTSGAATHLAPNWSRDGQWIYFGSNRTGRFEIWKLPSRGPGVPVQVTRNGGMAAHESVDGKTLYYAKTLLDTGVWRMAVGGGEEELVIPSVNILHNFVVVPDGIYYQTGRLPALWFYRFASGESQALGPLGQPSGQGMAVSADGKSILFTSAVVRGENLWLIENIR